MELSGGGLSRGGLFGKGVFLGEGVYPVLFEQRFYVGAGCACCAAGFLFLDGGCCEEAEEGQLAALGGGAAEGFGGGSGFFLGDGGLYGVGCLAGEGGLG